MKTLNPRRYLYALLPLAALAVLCAVLAQAASPSTPTLSAGQKAPAFQATTTDGKAVKFPDDYKGKVVLLDFWATWCGPCVAELPNDVSAYDKYHGMGFDVLGVSLDKENWSENLAKFTKDHKMPWPQIYDGKYWKAEIAVQYGINSIPRPILVDGDTGLILVEGTAARGANLAPAIEKALAAKKK